MLILHSGNEIKLNLFLLLTWSCFPYFKHMSDFWLGRIYTNRELEKKGDGSELFNG